MSRKTSRLGLCGILLAALAAATSVTPEVAAEAGSKGALQAGASVVAAAAQQSGGEVVYHWKKVVTRGEAQVRAREDLVVRTIVEEMESGKVRLDMERLVDDQGRAYQMTADAWQESEDAPVVYEIKLTRHARQFLDEASIEEEYRIANPRASEADVAAFLRRRRTAPEPPRTDTELADDLPGWLEEAGSDETIDVVVKLQDTDSGLRLPRVAASLFDTEPAFALEQMEARLLAMEARKNELETLREPVVRDLERQGGRMVKGYWVINGFKATVTPAALRHLARDPRVLRIERFVVPTPDTNNLDDMRAAAQIVQFHASSIDGQTPSGRTSAGAMYLAVIDDNIDADHPAWRDTSSAASSRLVDIWRETGGVWGTVATSATALPSHGTKVTAIALADLMQGQDPAITAVADRDDRTGFAPEAEFSFIESGAGTVDSIEKAIDLGVDVINYSASVNYNCNLSHSSNDAVDEAMLDGIFFAKSSGSNGAPGAACNIGTPGAASGAFSVSAIDRSAVPLNTGLVTSGSSHGPDTNGRAVVAIAAYAGPEGSTAAAYDDTYGVFGATSAAAPVIAGSAAVLKDHFMSIFSPAIANEVGYLYASMLVMGDGQMDSGVAMAQDEVDGKWGTGRVRMRMFDHAGMDGPWRMRLISRTISDGEVASDLYLNPDSGGVNQPLPADVDRIRATVFWHEPNIEDAVSNWADISSTLCNDDGFCYSSGNSSDQRQRHRIGNVSGDKEWWLVLGGLNVPDSNDTNYHYGRDERKVYVAVYWEDGDRDDADGPTSDIQ